MMFAEYNVVLDGLNFHTKARIRMESNGFEKMRSGILEIRKVLHKIYIGEIPMEKHTISAVIGRCDSMLEIPLRNCDVGTTEEQEKRYHETGELYHTLTLTNVLEWSQQQYRESEDK